MKNNFICLIILTFFCLQGFGQSAEIRPNQGVSVPQFTTAFITALTGQPKGTVVFDKDLNVMKYWDGTSWQSMSSGGNSWTTNGADMYNTNTGNVGIGTTTPYAKLHVSGTTNFTGGTTIDGSTNITPIVSSSATDGPLKVYSPMGGNLISGWNFITIDKSSIQARYRGLGFVGGSVSESSLKLNPYGGKVGVNSADISLTSNLEVYRSLSGVNNTAVFKGTTHYSHFHYSTNENTYIRGGKDGSSVILNDIPNGKVGVGRVPTIYPLEVNGTMKANEVIVETGWADYVFDEKYKLRSIEEMEAFVKENKHLPNIPSAAEIEKNGLKVGETNKAMMEKIEELSLYIIQLKKEIDILKSKLN